MSYVKRHWAPQSLSWHRAMPVSRPLIDEPVIIEKIEELPQAEMPVAQLVEDDVICMAQHSMGDEDLPIEEAVINLRPMNQVHLIGGEKGGVGKSVMARAFAQYCIDKKIPFQGFDSDRSHGSFQRFYQEYTQHVVLEDFQSLDQLAEAALRGSGVQVIVDLAAQSSTSLRTWMEDTGVLELFREAGVIVNCWHILDDGRDSLEMLGRLLENFQTEVRYVIALNHGRGSNFDVFHTSPQKLRAIELGAKIIELPKLHEASMRLVDHTNSSFWAATNQSEDGTRILGVLERQRVKVWLRKLYSELDTLHLRPDL